LLLLATATAIAAALVPAAVLAAPQPVPCPGGVCLPVPASPAPLPPIGSQPFPTASPSPSQAPGPIPPPLPAPPPLTPEANLNAVAKWIFGGANWMTCLLPDAIGIKIDPKKCPSGGGFTITLPSPSDWFAPLYRRMVEIAGLLLLPILLLALLQALIRGDGGMALRSAFGYVPLAVIASAIAVGVTQMLLGVTDSFSNYMLNGYQNQLALTFGSLAGVMAAGAAGTAFTLGTSAAAVIAAIAAMVALLAILIELLTREALIYAAVLFLPLGFAAMVWPQLMPWTRRLVEVVIAAILAKFLIVSVLVLGAAAFTAIPPGGGPFDSQAPPGSTLIVGLLLVALAAMAPVALLWALPSFEAAAVAQFHGSAGRPLTSVPQSAERAIFHRASQKLVERGRAGVRPVVVVRDASKDWRQPPPPPTASDGTAPIPPPPSASPPAREERNARAS
jgi:hypothetical protein